MIQLFSFVKAAVLVTLGTFARSTQNPGDYGEISRRVIVNTSSSRFEPSVGVYLPHQRRRPQAPASTSIHH